MARLHVFVKNCSFLILVVLTVHSEELPFLQQVKQWFEWGEYVQIMQAVNPVFADTNCSLSADTAAYLHLYLGVACFAEGDIWKARKEFIIAINLMPAVELDRKYVNQEIFNFFNATLEETASQHDVEKNKDSLEEQNARIQEQNVAVIDSLDKTVYKVKKRGLFVAAVSMTVVSIGLAGVAVYEYDRGDQEYVKFVQVSKEGDFLNYQRLKESVKKYDHRTVLAGCGSGVFAITSGILYAVSHAQRADPEHKVTKQRHVSVSAGFSSAALNIHF